MACEKFIKNLNRWVESTSHAFIFFLKPFNHQIYSHAKRARENISLKWLGLCLVLGTHELNGFKSWAKHHIFYT